MLDIGKGHAEHLMAAISLALAAAATEYADLSRIVVAVGPGSFTGIRVGVAAARGLSLALKIPAIGISNLEAVTREVQDRHPRRAVMVAFASARGDVQAALYDPFANLLYDPAIMSLDQVAMLSGRHDAVVAGSAASLLSSMHPGLDIDVADVTADIATYARLGVAREPAERPKPLYLREPDARPQSGFAVARAST